jgi:hypothetical protein
MVDTDTGPTGRGSQRLPAMLQWMMPTGISLIVALMVWALSWLGSLRDDVANLRQTVPLQIQALDRRVTANEQHLQRLDDVVVDEVRREDRRAATPSPP